MIKQIDTAEAIAVAPITYCRPGVRSKNILDRPKPESSIRTVTQTALKRPQAPSTVPTSKDDRRTAQERVEAAERAEALSVVLAQPHRAGSEDPLAGSALGRFCLRRWPGEARRDFRADRCEAGNRFAQTIDNDRVARGLAPRLYGESAGGAELTDEQLQARRDLCAQQRVEAEAEVRDVHPRAVSVMSKLCWEDQDIGPYDEDLVFHALYRLARHFGIEKRTFHEAGA